MFFPSTSEKVLYGEELETEEGKKAFYLKHPTIMISNPNALYYHHMVNAPNAFWLNFFLKKGINVMCWNYRNYGHSKGTPSPYNIKTDAEAVFNFMLKDLKLRGPLGVYGRSMGGTSATHLANKYKNLVSLLIADRTFGNLKEISGRKL